MTTVSSFTGRSGGPDVSKSPVLKDQERPRLLDLFCCAGGAGTGYARAGWQVTGMDIEPQPHYPFRFQERDVLEIATNSLALHWIRRNFDVIHASPPCQEFTVYRNARPNAKPKWPNLIPQTRELLQLIGLPWVMENVPGAPLVDPVRFCGTALGIRVRRHRMFESSFDLQGVACDHKRFTDRIFPGSSNRPNGRTVCNVGEYRVPLGVQKEHMQVDWNVSLHELSEMVPPCYTENIGKQMLMLAKEQAA